MPKNREPLPDFSDVHVRLKPLLGVAPGAYLAVLYSLALLLLVFLFLFLPGLKANGTVVTFVTDPKGAGVWVDGQYKGATPRAVFVKRGERNIELRKAFYETERIDRAFGGRLVGSLFFPRRTEIASSLKVADPQGLAAWAREQVAQWGLLRELSPAYPLPHDLSVSVTALARLHDPRLSPEIDSLLRTAAAATDSEEELRELIAAATAAGSEGRLLSSVGLSRTFRAAEDFAQRTASFPLWVAEALDSSTPARAALLANPAFASQTRRLLDRLRALESAPPLPAPAGAPVVAGIRFLPVPGGTQLVGRPLSTQTQDALFPHAVRLAPFYLAETEVTRAQFAEFLAAEPQWADRAALVREGKASDTYLQGWEGGRPPAGTASLPVVDVSYFAAEAFSAWLTTRLPPGLGGYEARLPSEAEWQRAARGPHDDAPLPAGSVFLGSGSLKPAGASAPGPYGQRDLWGNAWEWCSDAYLPERNLLSAADPAAADPLASAYGAERVVKGGSWANSRDDFLGFTRGSQPPQWCTAFTGFRVALVRR